MDAKYRQKFLELWSKYFGESDLPIVFFYTDEDPKEAKVKPSSTHRCVFIDIMKVMRGKKVAFDKDSTGCQGGKRYFGFSKEIMPDFEYFLSCGKEGMEGERYKKDPQIVREMMKNFPSFEAPGKYILFKRFDMLEDEENPDVVIFFGNPDLISGLFTLANFDKVSDNVRAPFGAGCSSIVFYPYLEKFSEDPKCILGTFDISARPYVKKEFLSFSVPLERFYQMVDNIEISFLTTKSWKKIERRLRRSYGPKRSRNS